MEVGDKITTRVAGMVPNRTDVFEEKETLVPVRTSGKFGTARFVERVTDALGVFPLEY